MECLGALSPLPHSRLIWGLFSLPGQPITRPARSQGAEKPTTRFGTKSSKIIVSSTHTGRGRIGAIFVITTWFYSLRKNRCWYFNVHSSRFIQNTYFLFIFMSESTYFPENIPSICFYFCSLWKNDTLSVLQYILGHISVSMNISLF